MFTLSLTVWQWLTKFFHLGGGVKCGSVSQNSYKTSHFSEQKTTQEWTPLWLEFERKKRDLVRVGKRSGI